MISQEVFGKRRRFDGRNVPTWLKLNNPINQRKSHDLRWLPPIGIEAQPLPFVKFTTAKPISIAILATGLNRTYQSSMQAYRSLRF